MRHRHTRKRKTRGVASSSPSTEAAAALSICSYNIQMTMFHMTEHRLQCIVRELRHIGTDVVCLQECFEAHAIQTICDALQSVYRYSYQDTQNKPFYNTNSGLVILSKYPIEHVHYERYTSRTFVDALAHKGFVCCEIVAPSHRLVLCNTHLQADYPLIRCAQTRHKQMEQLFQYIHATYVGSKVVTRSSVGNAARRSSSAAAGSTGRGRKAQWPIVLCGDWNIPYGSEAFFKDLQTCAKAALPTQHYTLFDRRSPERARATNADGLLDYYIVCPREHSAYHASQQRVRTNPVYTFSDHKWTMMCPIGFQTNSRKSHMATHKSQGSPP